jgi:hypothetical protein
MQPCCADRLDPPEPSRRLPSIPALTKIVVDRATVAAADAARGRID